MTWAQANSGATGFARCYSLRRAAIREASEHRGLPQLASTDLLQLFPTSGRVMMSGANLVELSPAGLARFRRRTVGYVFQELNLLSGLTSAENLICVT